MNSLVRNNTTAEQAQRLEDAAEHPLRAGVTHTAQYFNILESRRKLPVTAQRQSFLDVYHQNQVIVLISETGSGKTTQIPQFVLFDEYASGKMVACTQPRRLAAISVAGRVADEMDVKLGEQVGYSVRFDNKMNADTRLKYMTDGLLLQEALLDANFSAYACIIIDEAHERTMSTDILMALLKNALKKRDDLKVVIMSATMNADKFVQYFGLAAPFNVPGRSHPVEIRYLQEATPNWPSCALHTIKHISDNMGPGDILLFVPTVQDTEGLSGLLNKELGDKLRAMPLYAALARGEQQKVFDAAPKRKCIVSTNIAETSLTIDGIVYVVDTGIMKQSGYNPRGGMETLMTVSVSQASARQRAGRAGRTRPGMCFRLYTEETFEKDMLPSTPPGIRTSDITQEVLRLMSMGYHDVASFDFVDPPDTEVYLRAIQELYHMGYIDYDGKITTTGRKASLLSVHPMWYNVIVEGQKLGCGSEMVSLAAFSSLQNSVFLRPWPFRLVADAAKPRFGCPTSDHVSQLHAMHAYFRAKKQDRIDMQQWCSDAFLNLRVLDEVLAIRQQLATKVAQIFGKPLSCAEFNDEFEDKIAKALARGLYHNAAIHKGDDIYQTVHDSFPAALSADSCLIGMQPEWVVFDKISYVGKTYLNTVTAVKPEWLVDLPFFQDDKLSLKRDNKTLRQPLVKESLDAARARNRSNAN